MNFVNRLPTAATLVFALCGASLCAAQTATPIGAPVYAPVNAMPFYGLEDAVQGIYAFQIPPLAQRIRAQSAQLVQETDSFCQGDTTLGGRAQPVAKHTGELGGLADAVSRPLGVAAFAAPD
ncbi:hypothetical protein [Rhodoferax sp. PAMC 29310]|uniref:hypothetical protein n=1 Tax=Rhodoferax sp. PAMC 29310 TaxID=2822760 RepID=UPI001B334399|nr:hypothetical protein [Rhodoferax sp. PAMC 29310]